MKRRLAAILVCCLLTALLGGCGAAGIQTAGSASDEADTQKSDGVPAIEGLTFLEETPLKYATQFSVFHYEGGYSVIIVADGREYLVVPEGGAIPAGTENYIIVRQPLKSVYLVASSAMSLFCALDSLDTIRLSGIKEDAWYIEAAKNAMISGEILYAGKYAEPDYELITNEGCTLAVESTMIYHTPETLEKIEELGIPVFVDRSSYETHPLGRTEWIKLYAALLGKETEADALFAQQAAIVDQLANFENTEKTIAYFYVNSNGTVSVRKSSDYIAAMIELAGGRYIFQELGDPDSVTSSVTMTMEEFYAAAREADYIIYNATIDDPLETVEQLLEKSNLFADFKAVQEGNVWCTGKYLYQATDVLGGMIGDIHTMLTNSGSETELTFIHKLS